MVIACPYTPNFWKVSPDVEATITALSNWIFEVLVPRLRASTPVRTEREFLGLDGVSLGGYASLGIGIRRAADLGSIGCVQAAISIGESPSFADRFAKSFATSGARPLHLLTSTADVFRKPVESLDAALTAHKVPHDFRLAIGPHDQPFLRGPGSVEMLLWHARSLAG
jgi:enterochelin esterase-like enzyme